MHSQKTTHILLVILIVGIFFLIFLFLKEKYFTELTYQPISQEESAYVSPTNNQVNQPIINQTSAPNPTPTPKIQENIPLVAGKTYQTMFSNDGHAKPYTYCGEGELTYDDVAPVPYYYFLPQGQGCSDDMPGEQENAQYMGLVIFSVSPKPTTTQAEIENLNSKYGVNIVGKTGENYNIRVNTNTSQYNTYTLAKIYFDSGLFYATWMKDVRYY